MSDRLTQESAELEPAALTGRDQPIAENPDSPPKRARQAAGLRRSPGDPATDPARDYVTLCVSTYPADLVAWDAEVERRKAAGERKASRSSVIREAMAELIARGR